MRKQSRLRTIFAVSALSMLVVAGGASLTTFTARRTAWRLTHSYARVARFSYRPVVRKVASASASVASAGRSGQCVRRAFNKRASVSSAVAST